MLGVFINFSSCTLDDCFSLYYNEEPQQALHLIKIRMKVRQEEEKKVSVMQE